MAAQRIFYLPLNGNLKDSTGIVWTGSGYTFAKPDANKDLNGLFLQSQSAYIKTTGSRVSLGSGNWVIKFYLYIKQYYQYNDIFYDNGNGLLCCLYSDQIQIWGNGTTVYFKNHGMTTGKWYHFALIKNGTNLTLKIDEKVIGTLGVGSGTYTSPEYLGGGPVSAHSFVGYLAEYSLWKDTIDESLDYSYAEKQFETSYFIPNDITGVYDRSPNGLKYSYRVRFSKSSNVVNYETCQKLRLLMYLYKILIISIFLKTLKIRVVS